MDSSINCFGVGDSNICHSEVEGSVNGTKGLGCPASTFCAKYQYKV